MEQRGRGADRYVGRHFRKQQRRRAPFLVAAGSAVAVVVIAALAVVLTQTGRAAPVAAVRGAGGATAATTTARGAGALASGSKQPAANPATELTSVGPDGVQSAAIAAENAKPGTTAWRITSEPATGYIEGWADTTYAAEGQTVRLYVSTSAPSFQVVAYRMGWYGGLGGREVWRSQATTGVQQPACRLDPTTNMVGCDNWSVSLEMPVTAAFMQGDYLLKLVGSGDEEGYVLLTVWNPRSTAAYLMMARSLTEEGWNTYGGYSYYQGKGPCILGQMGSYPVCNRARVVSFDRPDDTNHGASDFLSNEFPLVQLMEKDGLDVAYCTDVTVDEHPSVVLAHRALLSLGHDETWTYNERKAAQEGLRHGVNFFFGAASVLRHSRLQASSLGPDRQEVDYRDYTEDPLYRRGGDPMNVTGNTWSSPPANWSEIPFVGEEYSGYLTAGASAPLVVTDSSSWVYDGTGLQDGSELPGVVVSDFDHLDPYGGSPADVEVLGHSPVPLTKSFTTQGTWGGYTYSDMTYYTDRASGGGVLDAGTVNWIYALTACPAAQQDCPAATVARITENVLRVFGSGPAGQTEPSVANWRSTVPTGS